jgi:hypothetical protein
MSLSLNSTAQFSRREQHNEELKSCITFLKKEVKILKPLFFNILVFNFKLWFQKSALNFRGTRGITTNPAPFNFKFAADLKAYVILETILSK